MGTFLPDIMQRLHRSLRREQAPFASAGRKRVLLLLISACLSSRRLYRTIMTNTEVLSPPPLAAVPLAADASPLKLDALNLPMGSAHLLGGAVELSNTQIGDVATFARSSFRNEAVKAGAVSGSRSSASPGLFRFRSSFTGLLAKLCCTCRWVVPGGFP